jgi:RNA recognition motif-containing protein
MDENYITQILAPISPLVSVKLIKDKNTGQNMGYGFLEFQTHQAAQSILGT